jgi:hypothetical protein
MAAANTINTGAELLAAVRAGDVPLKRAYETSRCRRARRSSRWTSTPRRRKQPPIPPLAAIDSTDIPR